MDRAGPALSLKGQIAIAVVSTALFVWVLPALIDWMKHEFPAPVHALAQETPEAELARRYAAVLAACFNGGSITDGSQVIECRRR